MTSVLQVTVRWRQRVLGYRVSSERMIVGRRTGTIATALRVTLAACATITMIGCATKPNETIEPAREGKIERSTVLHSLALDPTLEERILALDPEHVSDYDVRSTLAAG